MPIPLTHPGVYIQEVSSGVRTITGVATSITAFVDHFAQGPSDGAVQVLSLAEFERLFGGLDPRSEASYAIHQFFQNGGAEAWIARAVSSSTSTADVEIASAIGGSTVLKVSAINPGAWGGANDGLQGLRISIDDPPASLPKRFNLTVALVRSAGGKEQVVTSESFFNLSMDPASPSFVKTLVNDDTSGSKLIRIKTVNGTEPPLATGTLSRDLSGFTGVRAKQGNLLVSLIGEEGRSGTAQLSGQPRTLVEARLQLEQAIQSCRPDDRAFAQARVQIVNEKLRILAGPSLPGARIRFEAEPASIADQLGLTAKAQTLKGLLSTDIAANLPLSAGNVDVTESPGGTTQTLNLAGPMADLNAAAVELQKEIRAATGSDALKKAIVLPLETGSLKQLLVLSGDPAKTLALSKKDSDALFDNLGFAAPDTIEATLSDTLPTTFSIAAGQAVQVSIGADGPFKATFANAAPATDPSAAAAGLQEAIRAANPARRPSFTEARVLVQEESGAGKHLVMMAGGTTAAQVRFAAPDTTTVTDLALDSASANVQSYRLGGGKVGSTAQPTAQKAGTEGVDGDLPGVPELIAAMRMLDDIDLFNILCIPRASMVIEPNALDAIPAAARIKSATLIKAAANYCSDRRAMLLVDPPNDLDSVEEVRNWLNGDGDLRSRNAALYFPRLLIPDPLNDYRLRNVGPSGTMAGLYARTDSDRGVWKAPAGTEASLKNVQQMEVPLNDGQNGVLNPIAINCLRTFPAYGKVCWGARTLDGSDQRASEWKYVPVRRLALFLEESLYRGTQWVVFEPNDEPLWAQIRLNIGAFLQNLFRQGAFQGRSPREAYFVRCDRETTTQNDINLGVVNILVGFAPLKPAEFVVISFQQIAGQIAT